MWKSGRGRLSTLAPTAMFCMVGEIGANRHLLPGRNCQRASRSRRRGVCSAASSERGKPVGPHHQPQDVSARYPWELLEDRWSQTSNPPAVISGLLRQLKAQTFRQQPSHTSAATAFVVGDPDLSNWDKFADLPGARKEAELVAGLLDAEGYQVRKCIGDKTRDVIEGLHFDGWRILHLAGHGVHEYLPEPGAGTRTATGADMPCNEREINNPYREW